MSKNPHTYLPFAGFAGITGILNAAGLQQLLPRSDLMQYLCGDQSFRPSPGEQDFQSRKSDSRGPKPGSRAEKGGRWSGIGWNGNTEGQEGTALIGQLNIVLTAALPYQLTPPAERNILSVRPFFLHRNLQCKRWQGIVVGAKIFVGLTGRMHYPALAIQRS